MLGRTPTFLLAMGAAIGGPYLLNNSAVGKKVKDAGAGWIRPAQRDGASELAAEAEEAAGWLRSEADELLASAEASLGADQLAAAHAGLDQLTTAEPEPELAGPVEMSEALRFEVDPAWVLGHWPRVSTRLAELELEGLRVPWVSGTRDDDLAGSLTYYFAANERLQRITFFGTTGDGRKLVALLTALHGFQRQTSDDPRLYLYQVRGQDKALSELRIWPADVVRADEPRARFNVALWIERPGGER